MYLQFMTNADFWGFQIFFNKKNQISTFAHILAFIVNGLTPIIVFFSHSRSPPFIFHNGVT